MPAQIYHLAEIKDWGMIMIPNAFTFRKTRHPEYRTVLSCLAALAFLLLGAPAGATDHSGAITADATWLAADNPHVIVSSVIVQAGATLTLQPGVQVVGNSGQLLQIQGQLQAQGLSGQEITLDRNAATGTWGGIYVQTAGTIDLDHCVIDNAYYGISHGSSGAVALNNCSISGGSYGIYATGSGPIQLASTTISGAIISGFQGTGIAPTFLDGASVFAECVTGIRINNVNGLNWTSAVTVENCSATGVYLANCDTPSLNNLILRDNTGTNGALMLDNCGDFTLGAGNQIGGSGDENTWPVSMTAGSYPSAGCIIPTTGNTNNDIRVHAGASDHSGVWRKFADLDYIITASPQVQAGGSLTIEPQVRVLSNSGQGLAIYGELIAEAGAGQEIVLDRNGATGSWAGIYVQGGGTASLDHCLLDYGYYGINQSSTGTTTVANTTITHAQNGIRAANGQVQLASCLISDSAYGFFGAGVQPTLLDSATLFQGNGTGIYLSNLDQMVWSTPAVITGSTSVGMHLANCLTPSLDNLVMTDNTGTNGAFMMDNCGDFTLGAGNQIGGSGDENTWPVSMTAGSYPSAGCIIPTTGNTNNDIRVHAGASDHSGVWRKFADLDYIITASPQVQAGGSLTIEPRVRVLCNSGQGLAIYGELIAEAEAGQEIVLDRNGATGSWAGIYVQGGGTASLDHCLLDYGYYGINQNSTGTTTVASTVITHAQNGIRATGGQIRLGSCQFTDSVFGFYGDGVRPTLLDAASTFDGNGTGVYLRNLGGLVWSTRITITGSTTTGLHLVNCSEPSLNNLVLTGNTGVNGALMLDNCGDFTLGAGNQIGGEGSENTWPVSITAGSYPAAGCVIPLRGNTSNDIRVHAGASDRSGTWRKFPGLDYIITASPQVQAGGTLTIDPMVHVLCHSGQGLSIYGTLTTLGELGKMVLFDRVGASGTWSGIYVQGAGEANLAHCRIDHANYGVYHNTSGTSQLTHNILRNGQTGLYLLAGTVNLLHNRIHDNLQYGIYISGGTPVFGSIPEQWNDIHGNGSGNAGRALRNGPDDLTAAYVYWGTVLSEEISTAITDNADDANLGVVTFIPFSDAAHDPQSPVHDPQEVPGTLPERFDLAQNYPNPFNPRTAIAFDLTRASAVKLEIFNLAGARVVTLVDEVLPAGRYRQVWDGRDGLGRAQASGVFFYRITSDEGTLTRRMTMVR
jgi:uncharacterized membrane protein